MENSGCSRVSSMVVNDSQPWFLTISDQMNSADHPVVHRRFLISIPPPARSTAASATFLRVHGVVHPQRASSGETRQVLLGAAPGVRRGPGAAPGSSREATAKLVVGVPPAVLERQLITSISILTGLFEHIDTKKTLCVPKYSQRAGPVMDSVVLGDSRGSKHDLYPFQAGSVSCA